MPSHAHTGGGHTHGKGADYHTAADATPVSARVSVYNTNPTNSHRVAGDHSHYIYPQAQADTTVSASAAGTISGTSTPVPDSYSIVWISPTSGTLKVVPTGALMLWAVGSTPPAGWQVVTAANRLLLRGADSGEGSSAFVSGHAHTMAPAAHDLSHQHGGSGSALASDASTLAEGTPDVGNGTPTISAAAAPGTGLRANNGHSHLATYTIAAANPGLSAASAQPVGTVSGDAALPLHKRLVLIRKV